MKKNLLQSFVFIFLINTFTSCKKEKITDNNAPIPPTVSVDSNYLSRIYYSDIEGGVTDIFETLTYVYDNNKRVIQLIDSTADNTSQSLEPSKLTQYFYNGNDSLPYKLVENIGPFVSGNYDTVTRFLYYNSQGLSSRRFYFLYL